jgi:nitroimidazol reductase NimA-like FMN-containing flavoprotein (pyridoxamine 5'-phosphate oxidase superfamily)
MDLTMTPAERWTFLTEVPRVCVLSVDAPERAPVSSPIWFTADDGKIAFAIGPQSRKAELLRRSRRATICVQSEDVPYKYVTIEGPVEDIGRATEAFRRSEAVRYLGPELGDLYIAGTSNEVSDTWVLRPERWSSIDYAKLPS